MVLHGMARELVVRPTVGRVQCETLLPLLGIAVVLLYLGWPMQPMLELPSQRHHGEREHLLVDDQGERHILPELARTSGLHRKQPERGQEAHPGYFQHPPTTFGVFPWS